jgi:GAF domain-containing protein
VLGGTVGVLKDRDMANQISRIQNRVTLLFSIATVVATILLIVAIPNLSDLSPAATRRVRTNSAIFAAAVLIAGIVLLRLYLRPISDLSYALEIGSTPALEIARDARRIAFNAPVYIFVLSTGGVLVISFLYNLIGTLVMVDHILSAHIVPMLLSTAVAACGSLIVAFGCRHLMQPVLLYTSARAQAGGIRVPIRARVLAAILSVVLLAVLLLGAYGITYAVQEETVHPLGSRQAGGTVAAAVLSAALSIGLALMLGHLLGRDLVSEIEGVSNRLYRAAHEERLSLSSPLPVLARDEVGDLVLAHNALQRRIRTQQEEVEHKQRQLVALQSLTYKIGTVRDAEHLLQQVIRDVERAFGYHNVSILLMGEDGKELHFAATELLDASLRQRRFRVGMDGVVGRVAATGEPLLVNDVSACDFYIPDGTNTRSELAVPLTLNNEVIGVLNVSSERTGAFEESDLRIVTALANQVAIAIENARLLNQMEAHAAELERRTQSLDLLHDLSLSISAAVRQQDLLHTVTEQLASLPQVEHCAVLWIDADENKVWVAAEHPLAGSVGQQMSLHQVPTVQRILTAPQSRQFADVQCTESLGSLFEFLADVDVGAMLLVPVMAKGRVKGAIVLSTSRASRAFRADELLICEMVAAQAGVAMQNVRLMEVSRLQGPRSESARSGNARSENARPQSTRSQRAHE